MIRKTLFLLLFALSAFCDLAEEFRRAGYVEILDSPQSAQAFDALYAEFDLFVEFLQTHPAWERKLFLAKERFIRSKERYLYGTEFFGLYDESKRARRHQISFYYSSHFHAFILNWHPELASVPEITRFLDACFVMQRSYRPMFEEAAAQLGRGTVFNGQEPPVLFKVVKYLSSYAPARPHYDGTAFSLFLNSTDDGSLLLSPYKPSFVTEDFFSPPRRSFPSVLLIPGTLLTEFSIPPTPHIVIGSGKTRYAAIAFAMRPNYVSSKVELASLPDFSR